MQQNKIKVDFNGVARTSIAPLYARAKISNEYSSIFNDAKAVELAELIDSGLFTINKVDINYLDFPFVARAIQFDNVVKAYIKEHPHSSVINLGTGFDTGFYRVDNGTIHWYDLDLPEVIEVRKQLIPETDRSTCIAKSLSGYKN